MPAAQRLEQILDAAAEIFAKRGYRNTSTAAIAAAVGVGEPTLYRYFPSKRALYLAVLDRSADAQIAVWRKIAESSPTPMEGLRAAGRWYFLQMVEKPQPLLLRARAIIESVDEEVAKHVRERFLATFEFIKGLYDRAQASGVIDPRADTASYAWLFMGVGALLDQALLMELKSDFDIEQMRRIMAIVWPSVPAPASQASSTDGARKTKDSPHA
jgi:AcrR family transcriptional regulator